MEIWLEMRFTFKMIFKPTNNMTIKLTIKVIFFSEALIIMSQLNNSLVGIINDNPFSNFYDCSEVDISEFVEKTKTFENEIYDLKEDNKYYKSEITN